MTHIILSVKYAACNNHDSCYTSPYFSLPITGRMSNSSRMRVKFPFIYATYHEDV